MDNTHLRQRLEGILQILKGAHAGSSAASNYTKGVEREAFIHGFLQAVLPATVRFGSGEVTDTHNNISGQLDIVLEYPFLPSVPLVPGLESRLYLAEGVAAVIEVKSNLSKQWPEVTATAEKLGNIRRHFGETRSLRNRHPFERIPLIAVGYEGWQDPESLKMKLQETPSVAAILDIRMGFFCAKLPVMQVQVDGTQTPAVLDYGTTGVDALWGLVSVLNELINDLAGAEALASNYTFHMKSGET
jgi:hypothetical protein